MSKFLLSTVASPNGRTGEGRHIGGAKSGVRARFCDRGGMFPVVRERFSGGEERVLCGCDGI